MHSIISDPWKCLVCGGAAGQGPSHEPTRRDADTLPSLCYECAEQIAVKRCSDCNGLMAEKAGEWPRRDLCYYKVRQEWVKDNDSGKGGYYRRVTERCGGEVRRIKISSRTRLG